MSASRMRHTGLPSSEMHLGGRAGKGWPLAAALIGLPLSELGHVAVYLARYGEAGLTLQTQGIHGYFPQLLGLSVSLMGALLLAALVFGGLGRVALSRGMGLNPRSGQPPLAMFVVAAAVQLAVYVLQETVETLLIGRSLDVWWLVQMLAWGMAGQVPIAMLAAVGMTWLSIRFDAGVSTLRSLWQACQAWLVPPPVFTAGWSPVPDAAVRRTALPRTAHQKRGPPVSICS
jgi:hypothetical protein